MNNLLFEKTSNNKNASKRIRPIYKIIIFILVISFIVFSFSQLIFTSHKNGLGLFWKNIIKLFSFENTDSSFPSNTILQNSLNFLWITIRITLTGTVLGFMIAFVTSFLTSKKIVNKYIAVSVKLIILFLRSFPVIVFVYATKKSFEREFAAILIILWFSWIWSNKYLSDIISNIDFEGYKYWNKLGYGKIYSFNKQILVRGKNKYIMVFLYSLESNLRWTTMLATVGVIGLGFFINQNIQNNLELIGIPLVLLFVTILLIECISVILNKWLLQKKSRTKEVFNYKKIINLLLIFGMIGITIYQISIIEYSKLSFKGFFEFFSDLKYIDKNMWMSDDWLVNSWLLIIKLIYQVVAALSIAIIYALIVSITSSEKRNRFFIWIPIKMINNFIKIIPTLVMFYLFNPIFINPIGLGVVILGMHSGTVLANQLTSSINNIDDKIIKEYKKMGYSNIWIIKKLIWPTILNDLKTLSSLRGEVIFRNMITLGSLGISLIGAQLISFEDRNKIIEFSTHIWSIVITIFIYNFIIITYRGIKGVKKWRK